MTTEQQAEKNRLIEDFNRQIQTSKSYNHEETACSWTFEEGVILSSKDAQLVVDLLAGASGLGEVEASERYVQDETDNINIVCGQQGYDRYIITEWAKIDYRRGYVAGASSVEVRGAGVGLDIADRLDQLNPFIDQENSLPFEPVNAKEGYDYCCTKLRELLPLQSPALPSAEEAVAFANFIAVGNYEYCISPDGKGNEIVEWNEVEDPQFHGEDGPDEYTTPELYELFKQRK
jgi:hypothetical protein